MNTNQHPNPLSRRKNVMKSTRKRRKDRLFGLHLLWMVPVLVAALASTVTSPTPAVALQQLPDSVEVNIEATKNLLIVADGCGVKQFIDVSSLGVFGDVDQDHVDENTQLQLSTDYYSNTKIFAELFVTNRYGANVAQTHRTSDYRQGDERWWQEAMKRGLFVSDVGFDESAGIYSVDICLRVQDQQGEPLGVLKAVMNIQEIIELFMSGTRTSSS